MTGVLLLLCLLFCLLTVVSATVDCYETSAGTRYVKRVVSVASERCFENERAIIDETAQTPCQCAEMTDHLGMSSFRFGSVCEMFRVMVDEYTDGTEVGTTVVFSIEEAIETTYQSGNEFSAVSSLTNALVSSAVLAWTLDDPCGVVGNINIKKYFKNGATTVMDVPSGDTFYQLKMIPVTGPELCTLVRVEFQINSINGGDMGRADWENPLQTDDLADSGVAASYIAYPTPEDQTACFVETTGQGTRQEAEDFCHRSFGLLFNSHVTDKFDEAVDISSDIWVGLYRDCDNTYFEWQNGERVLFTNPNANPNHRCAYMTNGAANELVLTPEDCQAKHKIACVTDPNIPS